MRRKHEALTGVKNRFPWGRGTKARSRTERTDASRKRWGSCSSGLGGKPADLD